ncbi:MAG: urate hydroxylase PuuD [Candidatus Eisenbacteria bacterium]|uniref:Urate hydroxylase PuuD n=1 Tax=Eiseniibacteriota bacterium TaxID=2212470 RepID=A0A538U2S9_UNCEI|nr:MAG: urate hydroxylase PuuD [Candidatus Eisenbacteria bacterium]
MRRMSPQEWVGLALRWTHLIAGIAWIGSSFYFIWLDDHLERVLAGAPEAARDPDLEGSLWMVHSGGFYRVERRKVGPGRMPATLHWFKWEAAITWLSGALLLGLLYYGTGGLYLTDPLVSSVSPRAAVLVGLATIIGGWLVYDALWTGIGERRSGVALAISLVLLGGLVVFLCSTLSGRAAYVHVGAVLGTIMVANVWARILPAQAAMIRATEDGRTPDFRLGDKAKLRSVHNSYLTFPVLFAMISNHFPGTWGTSHRALVLGLLIGLGMGARHLMIGRGPRRLAWAVPMAGALVALVLLTAPARLEGSGQAPSPAVAAALAGEGAAPSFAQVQAIVLSRCVACHAQAPRIAAFGSAPGGVSFEDPARIIRYASRIRERVVVTRTMPLGNMTGMSEEERLVLARWIGHGAKTE